MIRATMQCVPDVGVLEQWIANLPEDLRDRVQERAAILWETGMTDDDAMRRAYELETGKTVPKKVLAGLARTKLRTDESIDPKKRGGGSAG